MKPTSEEGLQSEMLLGCLETLAPNDKQARTKGCHKMTNCCSNTTLTNVESITETMLLYCPAKTPVLITVSMVRESLFRTVSHTLKAVRKSVIVVLTPL